MSATHFARSAQGNLYAFVRTILKLNKIGRVGASVPLERRWMPWGLYEGWGRRRSTVEWTNRRTGMHRPWEDFCVYHSALTRELRRAWRAAHQRNEGSFSSLSSLSLLFSRSPFSRPPRSLASQGLAQPTSRWKTVTSTPSGNCNRNPSFQ